MSEFADRPLIAGTLIGLRAFVVRGDDLFGPVYPLAFAPGENLAHCPTNERPWFRNRLSSPMYDIMVAGVAMTAGLRAHACTYQALLAAIKGETPADPPEHRVGGLGCSCGFYAYTDGANDYSADGTPGKRTRWPVAVEALIEGYGTCTVGDRGFRASKARLVALIDPPHAGIAERYDVPVYSSRSAAVAARPLTSVSAA